jgi:hypothetical protein
MHPTLHSDEEVGSDNSGQLPHADESNEGSADESVGLDDSKLGKLQDDSKARVTDKQSAAGYQQNVVINVGNNDTSAMLATLARQYSDGNARLIIKYYAQGHRQASVSFILSMVFAVAGFVITAVAVVGYILRPGELTSTVVTGTSGAIAETVSVLFFRRADKGRDLMMGLVDKLLTDREQESKYIGAIALLDEVGNSRIKDALRAVTILGFTGSSISVDQLVTLANSETFSNDTTPYHGVYIYPPNGHSRTELQAQQENAVTPASEPGQKKPDRPS